MEITYQLSERDLAAFYDHFYARSKVLRRQGRRVSVWIPDFYVLLAAVLWVFLQDPILPLILLVAGIAMALIVPMRMKQQRRRLVGKMYGTRASHALFERQTLRTEHDGIVNETVAGVSTTRWPYVEGIESKAGRTFIYLGATRAHIVPRDGIIQGEYEAFVEDARQCYQASTAEANGRDGDRTRTADGETRRDSMSVGGIINPRTELVYRLAEQDLLAHSEHNATQIAPLRRVFRRAAIAIFFIFLMGAFLVWVITQNAVLAAVMSAVGLVISLFVPSILKRGRRKITGNVYRESKTPALLMPRKLQIESDFLLNETASGAGRINWNYIERIDTTDEHTFLYTDVVHAIVIPKHGVLRGDYDLFHAELLRHWQAAKTADVRQAEVS